MMKMDQLRCKTPHRVRNEFYMHLAGLQSHPPRDDGGRPCVRAIAVGDELQGNLAVALPVPPAATHLRRPRPLVRCALEGHRNPHRRQPSGPNRTARLVKRRPKTYKHLREPP